MPEALYAVVSYIQGELGIFINELRAHLMPPQAHLRAHITLLPPRPLLGSEEDACRTLEKLSHRLHPVKLSFGHAGLFVPITPTVYLSIEEGANEVRAVHDALNTGELLCYEALPYMPHLTVAAMRCDEEANRVLEIVRRRWAEYDGPRHATIDSLTFAIDSELDNQWCDIVTFPLRV